MTDPQTTTDGGAVAVPNLILHLVAQERGEQNYRWGGPAHDERHTFAEWATILAKKFGDLARLMVRPFLPADGYHRTPADGYHRTPAECTHGYLVAMRDEAVKIAAVAVALAEQCHTSAVAQADDPPAHSAFEPEA